MLIQGDFSKNTGYMSKVEELCIIESIKSHTLVRQDRINKILDSFTLNSTFFNQNAEKQSIDVLGKGRIYF